ncbi:MAG: tail fiber domain-containing protein [Sumerlaeia bacterium]
MKHLFRAKSVWLFAVAACGLLAAPTIAPAVPNRITYQGQLSVSDSAASGQFDFIFQLMKSPEEDSPVGSPILVNGVAVTDGIFSTPLDFDPALFDGNSLWLEIAVRPTGSTEPHTVLGGRVPILTVPYAHRAATAGDAELLGGQDVGNFAAIDHTHAELVRPGDSKRIVSVSPDGTVVVAGSNATAANGFLLGDVRLRGGDGSEDGTGPAGKVFIIGGSGASFGNDIGGPGGDVVIQGGAAEGTGNHRGGDIILNPGALINDSRDGRVEVNGEMQVNGQMQVNRPAQFNSSVNIAFPSKLAFASGVEFKTLDSLTTAVDIGNPNMQSGFTFKIADDINLRQPTLLLNTTQSEGNTGIITARNTIIGPGPNLRVVGGLPLGNNQSGGKLTLAGGDGSVPFGASSNADGGNVEINGGNGQGTRRGGNIFLTPGQTFSGDDPVNGSKGIVRIDGALELVPQVTNGTVNISTASMFGGRAMRLSAGNSIEAFGGNGGKLTLVSGNANGGIFGSTRAGGDVEITAGNAFAGGKGGNIVLNSGSGGTNDGSSVIVFSNRFSVGTGNAPAAGRVIDTSTGAFLSTGGTWTNASDRESKTDFQEIDPQDVLAKLLNLPITKWRYQAEDPNVTRMGPTSQDFRKAFGLGHDERSIGAVDADGVAFAAIKGLHTMTDERIRQLEAENEQLRTRLAAIEAALVNLQGAN